MKNFKGKIAVVTGAASGIGEAIAEKLMQEGMHVALADIEEEPLKNTVARLNKEYSTECVGLKTDVSKRESVEELAENIMSSFGAVHLLCNNAGVGAGFDVQNTSYDDWEWVLGVNLWGVIYGIKTFLPIMEMQSTECHIINTASTAGLVPGYGGVPYLVSKHGVVALSEAIFFDLKERNSNVAISVLCPYATSTRILESDRNRPTSMPEKSKLPTSEKYIDQLKNMAQSVISGVRPEELANITLSSVKEKQLYILPTNELDESILGRGRSIVEGIDPVV